MPNFEDVVKHADEELIAELAAASLAAHTNYLRSPTRKTKKPLHKANTELAWALWMVRVTPEQVVPELVSWVCGTQACFGGHLATWPEFQALGVLSPSEPFWKMMLVSEDTRLFGDARLFNARGAEGGRSVSDHEVVVNRLRKNLARLEGREGL